MPEGWVNVFDVQRAAERKLEPGARGHLSGEGGACQRLLEWVPRTLQKEPELTLGLCCLASPADLGPRRLRKALPSGVYSGEALNTCTSL